MNRKNLLTSLVAVLVVVAAAVAYLGVGARPELGLDLQGGISAVYTPVVEDGAASDADFDAVLDETIGIIRDRVDSLGVAEPEISRQGDDVLVQLPGLDDPERAREVIGTTAELQFRPVEAILLPGTPAYDETPACDDPDFPAPANDEAGVVCDADQGLPLLEDLPTPGTEGAATTGTGATGSDGDGPAATTSPTAEPTSTPTEGAAGTSAASDVRSMAAPSPSPTETLPPEADTSPAPATPTEPAPSPTPTELPSEVIEGLRDQPVKYQVGPTALTGDRVEAANPTLDAGGGWAVALDLDGEGGDAFAAITAELACRRDQGQIDQLAIVLDDRVESAPSMQSTVACGTGITGGNASITTGDQQEAQDLALVLKTGALPITLEPSTFETVSPTLGEDSLRSGLFAGLAGLALVAVYLVFFYRWLGVVAIGALAIFGVVMIALITLLGEVGFTLTLAGVAGIVVSIGITADSSIIFFERIRDEAGVGKTIRTSVKRAFDSAFRTNLAGNTVTLAAAVVLYFLAVGPVRGFALTLGIATVLDIVILWFYSRAAVGLLGQSRRLTRHSLRVPTPAPTAGAR